LIERRFGDSGAHHIDAGECRFGVDFGGVARKSETVVSDIQIKMFGHFVFVDDAADRERNLVLAAQRLFGAMNASRNGRPAGLRACGRARPPAADCGRRRGARSDNPAT
jgi:hypothetical protein